MVLIALVQVVAGIDEIPHREVPLRESHGSGNQAPQNQVGGSGAKGILSNPVSSRPRDMSQTQATTIEGGGKRKALAAQLRQKEVLICAHRLHSVCHLQLILHAARMQHCVSMH